ncbi:hypothetical protein ERJ75_000334900 [Trypanosoma vivax]|nr:hypothetical protein ERJ75_000334900 [Trypanosoma vivax]
MDLACGVSSARANVKTALAALLLRNPMRFVPAPASAEKPVKPSTRSESHSRRSFTALLARRPVAKETRNSVGWGKAAASATNARAPAHRSAPRRQSCFRQKLRTHPELNRGPIGLQPIALPLSYESTNARARALAAAPALAACLGDLLARSAGWSSPPCLLKLVGRRPLPLRAALIGACGVSCLIRGDRGRLLLGFGRGHRYSPTKLCRGPRAF